jgi:hypothetical protein
VLTSQPSSDVTVPISSNDTTEGTVSPTSLLFTPTNWSTAQTVTVTGVDDLVDDGDVAYVAAIGPATSLDANYQGKDPADLTFTNLDDDVASITVGTPSSTTTTESGGTATFTVVLTSEPTAPVSIPISSSDTTEGTVSASSLIFTALDWSVPQTVTVTGVDDLVDDGDVAYLVAVGPASSLDANYNGKDPADLTFTNLDDDAAGLLASPSSGLITTEGGGTATFDLTLSSQPAANVAVTLSSSDTTEGTVTPTSVTFTPLDWNVPQTITVTGVDDLLDDGDVAYPVQLAATSTDSLYDGATATVSVTNSDDDVAGITVGPPSELSTSEAGTTVTFTVALDSEPTADVKIPIASSDTTEGTVSPASLVFTTTNWSTAQTVTVTGVDDALDDGDQLYDVLIGPATSADPSYHLLDPSDILLANTDDDTVGIAVGTPSSTSTTEAGGSATFTVVLTSEPTSDVTVPISSSDTTEGSVSPPNLIFTALDWNVAQTVTVTGADDAEVDGDQPFTVLIGPAASDDASYQGQDPSDLGFTNVDDD